jgi:1,4-dihydroxy-2-naphthoate octaprenyltransferase
MLIFSGNLALLIYVILTQHWGGLLAFAVVPLMLKVGFGVQKGKTSSEIDPYLKKMAISTLLWVLLFGIGLLLI